MSEIIGEFMEQAGARCMLCGALPINVWPPKIECHHIARGGNRAKSREERCTLLAACQPCHRNHLDSMPIIRQLAIKAMNDGEYLDIEKTNLLRGRAPGAITEEEVATEISVLYEMIEQVGSGYPYTRHKF